MDDPATNSITASGIDVISALFIWLSLTDVLPTKPLAEFRYGDSLFRLTLASGALTFPHPFCLFEADHLAGSIRSLNPPS